MFADVAGRGFWSFFPRTVIRSFTCLATARSNFPGGLALQPASASSRPRETSFRRRGMVSPGSSFDHDGHLHVAVACAAEVVANGYELAGRLRHERHLGGFSGGD